MAKEKIKEKLSLEILTPEKVVLREDNIDIVVIRALDKDNEKPIEIGIMSYHAPMLIRLGICPIRYRKDTALYWAVVAYGFLEIRDNKITIISFGAEKIEREPDVDLAITAKKRVESWLLEGEVAKIGFDEKAAEADIKKSAIELYKASSHTE